MRTEKEGSSKDEKEKNGGAAGSSALPRIMDWCCT